ncbi:MAG TPA: NADPH:quinone oxidoreductase family protein [Beijerinckiaceae bacterium]|nr:NADPH:quinone oxidoreductase family protein [Beijerinckiaceae bacterium]
MLAVRVHEFGGSQSARLEQIADPRPAADEVVIEVRAAAVNFVDLLVIAGKYQFLPPRPFTPGKMPAGVVVELGSSVRDFALGDRVLAMAEHGAYAQKAKVMASLCRRLPPSMSFVEAASMALAFDTAWFALRERARLVAGETVLALGASGGVGLACVQLAKAFGARVIAGIASPEKAGLVLTAGAEGVVDLSAPDLRNSLREQVYALTDGAGADVIVDPLGDRFFEAALRSLAWCGRLVVVGFAAGEIPSVRANYLLVKNIEVSGLQISDYRKRRPERVHECLAEIFDLFERGVLTAAPTQELPLERFAEALRAVETRTAGARLVLVPGA